MKKSLLVLFTGLLSTFVFTACEVGLGSSVDTEAPKLSISYPDSTVVYKGEIPISGTWNDDKGVSSVKAKIINTETNQTVVENIIINPTKDNTWQTKVYSYPAGEGVEGAVKLADGKYSVEVTAYDDGGHDSGVTSRSFEVDSTAPVVVLSKPNSLSSLSPAKYGRTVKITGVISDDHSVTALKVKAFDESGNLISLEKDTFEGFDASDLSVVIAKNFAETEIPEEGTDDWKLYKNYEAMYENANETTGVKKLRFLVYAVDKGENQSNSSYIKTNLNTAISSITGQVLEAYELKSILNGSYSGSLLEEPEENRAVNSESKLEKIKKLLNGDDEYSSYNCVSKNADDLESAIPFEVSINKKANPTYEVLGYAFDGVTFKEATKDSSINIKLSAGLDGAMIFPNSIYAEFIQIDSANGQPTGVKHKVTGKYITDSSKVAINTNSDGHESNDGTAIDSGNYSIALNSFGVDEGGSPYSLANGQYYKVVVYGKDEDGNDMVPASKDGVPYVYAFQVATLKSAPTIKFANNGKYLKAEELEKDANNKAEIEIVTDDAEAIIRFDAYVILYKNTIKNNSGINEFKVENRVINNVLLTTKTFSEGKYTYKVDVPLGFVKEAGGENSTIAIRVKADNDGSDSTSTYYLYADNSAPQISFKNAELKLALEKTGTEKGKVDLITEKNSMFTEEDGVYTYTVNGLWKDITTENVEGSGTSELLYSWETTDKTQTAKWHKLEESNAPKMASQTSWNNVFTIEEGGPKTLSFYAKDEVGNESDVITFTNITFDYAEPTVSVGTVNDYYKAGDTASFTITAEDTSEISGVEVVIKKNGSDFDGSSMIGSFNKATGNKSGSVVVTIPTDKTADGSYEITAKAVDKAGRKTSDKNQVKFTTVIDSTPPTQNYDDTHKRKIGDNEYGSSTWYKDSNLKITDYFKEETSGLDTVYYSVSYKDGDERKTTDESSVSISNGKGNNVEVVFTASGFKACTTAEPNYLKIKAKDKAGNEYVASDLEILIDQNAPDFSSLYYTYDDDVYSSASGNILSNKKKNLIIYGIISDSESGVDNINFSINNTTVTAEVKYITESITDEEKTSSSAFKKWLSGKNFADKPTEPTEITKIKLWKATIVKDNIDNGGTVKAEFSDNAGNTSVQQIFTISVDESAPNPSITSPSVTSLNGKYEIKGTVSEENTPVSLKLYYFTTKDDSKTPATTLSNNEIPTTGDNCWILKGEKTTAAEIYNWSFGEFDFSDISEAKDQTNGTAYVYLLPVTKDSAGNCNIEDSIQEKKWTKITVDQNTDRPEIKITNLSGKGVTLKYGDNASITGNVSDDDGILKEFFVASETIDTSKKAIVENETTFNVRSKDKNSNYVDYSLTITKPTDAVVTKYEHTIESKKYYDVTIYDPSTGDWTFYPYDVSDDTKSMYFYIKDSNDGIFKTGHENTLNQPYLKFKTGSRVDNSSVVTYVSDSNSPTIKTVKIDYSSDGANKAGTIEAVSTSTVVGGVEKKWIRFVAEAEDASGISNINIVLKNLSGTETTYDSGANPLPTGRSFSNGCLTTEWIDVSAWAKSNGEKFGQTSAVITVTDGASLYNNTTLNFTVDNAAPVVRMTTPGQDPDSDVVTSTTKVTATVTDAEASVKEIWWQISKTAPSNKPTNANNNGWTKLESTSGVEINFDASTDALNILKFATSEYADETFTNSNIFKVPVWFYAIDNVGNDVITTNGNPETNTDKRYVYVDPDAGRPTTKILYPANDSKIGGLISVIGSATDKDGSIRNVYVQLGSITGTTFTPFTAAQYTSLGYSSVTFNSVACVKASGTNSWSLDINTSKFSGSGRDTTNFATEISKIGIKCCSEDNENKTRPFSTATGDSYVINDIDQDVPGVTKLRLVQYSGAVGGDISLEKSYVSDCYVSHNVGTGVWYLEGEAEDDVGKENSGTLGEVIFTTASGTYSLNGTATANGSEFGYKQITSGSDKKWKFWAKLPTSVASANGRIYTQLSVSDDATPKHTNTQYISIYVDNTAPALYKTDNTTDTSTTNTTLRLRVNESSTLGSTHYVVNSNGSTTTIGDRFVEADSGIKYIAFYFKRNTANETGNNAKNRVYNPMFNSGNRTNLTSDTTPATPAKDDVYINSDGLACMYMTGTRSETNKFTPDTDLSTNNNIRYGGIIKIGGMYTRFTKSGNELTLDDAVDKTFTTAEIILAQVVDHGQETSDTYGTPGDADGDGMIEKLSSSTGEWYAVMNSQNIPDGPIDITVVAIDNAGNISKGTITTAIQNNRPRLAKIMLGTDLDGNGTYDYKASANPVKGSTADGTNYGELNYYSCLDSNGNGQYEATLTSTSSFKVKNGMIVIPEFIGNNSNLKYTYQFGTTAGKTTGTITAVATAAAVGKLNAMYTPASLKATGVSALMTVTDLNTSDSTSIDLDGIIGNAGGIILTGSTQLGADGSKNIAFTFWDETETLIQGSTSWYALLKFPVEIDEVDETAPTALINPFYWHSSTENSLYGNSKENGHIELESDLTFTGTTFSSTGTGVNDLDPKVSGQIVVTGTVYDDKRLSKINLSFTGLFNETTLATYSSGAWTTTATLPTGVLSFNVYNDSLTQEGHSATWAMAVDTSNITGVAGVDKAITVIAYDTNTSVGTTFKGNCNTPGTTQTENAENDETVTVNTTEIAKGTTAYYKVDVVPYVKEVTTVLSGKDSNIARATNGSYIVSESENITFSGFNLTGAKFVKVEADASKNPAVAEDSEEMTGLVLNTSKIPASGSYRLKVGDVYTLNNVNKNDASGSAGAIDESNYSTKAYNRQPNSTNNKTLTDDLSFEVWQINNRAARTLKDLGLIKEPRMRYNPANGNIGFIFSNGPTDVSMANGISSSYARWQHNYASYIENALTFDESGKSHGLTIGIDTYEKDSKSGRLDYITSRWGNCNNSNWNDDANFRNKNVAHLESNGLPTGTYGGITFSDALILEHRFYSTTVAATTKNAAATYTGNSRVYIAYFDDVLQRILFRYGNVTDDNDPTSSGQGPDQLKTHGSESNSGVAVFYPDVGEFSVIADSSSTYKPGQYVDIAVIPGTSAANDVVVMVWFDATNNRMVYSYKTKPQSDRDLSLGIDASNGGWAAPTQIRTNCGEYCKIAVDGNGGVHITGYDRAYRAVVYSYAPSYSGSFTTVIVDSYNGPFDELSIDVGVDVLSTGKAYPSISYYANGTPKVATFSNGVNSSNAPTDGCSGNFYTGNWDISWIPTDSTLTKDHVNVAIPKKQNGERAACTTANGYTTANISGFATKNNVSGSATTGTVTGNGTTNPILGYAIRNGTKGYMEIAQKK